MKLGQGQYWDSEIGLNPWRTFRYHLSLWWAEHKPGTLKPGDIYEDCSYHPVLCTENDRGDLWGISLIDGTGPRGCSMFHCGPVKMTIEQALEAKKNWKQ